MEIKSIKYIIEALNIKKKNWNLSLDGFKVELNDDIEHNLIDRIKDRTNLSLNIIKDKLQNGLDYIGTKIEQDFFKNDKVLLSIDFTKSKFTALYLIKLQSKYIRVSSILSNDMIISKDIKVRWTLNEFKELMIDYKDDSDFSTISLNKNDLMFIVEDNTKTKIKEVYLNDKDEFIHFVLDI